MEGKGAEGDENGKEKTLLVTVCLREMEKKRKMEKEREMEKEKKMKREREKWR